MIGCLSIEPILSLFVFNYIYYTSITPQLVLQKICYNKYNESICTNLPLFKAEQLYIQKEASLWVMAIFLCETITAFFCVLFWGSLTDIIGRKKGFIYISVAMGMQNIILTFCAHFLRSSPGFILLASLTGGSYGSIPGVISICYSYIADITRHDIKYRTKRMGIVEACMFLSTTVSGLTSGFVLKNDRFALVYLLSGILTALIFIYTLILYKYKTDELTYENIDYGEHQLCTEQKHPPVSYYSRLNPMSLLKQIYITVTLNKHCYSLIWMLLVYLCAVIMFEGDLYLVPLYLKNDPFNFSSDLIGYYIAEFSILYAIGLLIAVYLAQYLDLSDYTLISVGFISQAVVYCLTGFSRSKLMFFLVRITGLFGSVVTPTIRSKISKLVLPGEYGCVLGGVMAVDVLGGVIVNFAGLSIYRISLDFYSGTVFFILASMSLVGVALMLCLWHRNSRLKETVISSSN